MTPSQFRRHHAAYAVIAVLWIAAIVSFVVTAGRGSTAFRTGQLVSAFCIIGAGVIVAVDWLGVTTAMGERTAKRWRGRTVAPSASDPQVAARSSRFLAWWWVGFGVLLLLLALGGPR